MQQQRHRHHALQLEAERRMVRPDIVRTRGIFQATGYPHVETLAREAIA